MPQPRLYFDSKERFRVRDQRLKRQLDLIRDTLLAEQGGVCAICGTTDPKHPRGWQLDHDHACCPRGDRACGQCYRGVLCHNCNTRRVPAVEQFGPETVAYLERYALRRAS